MPKKDKTTNEKLDALMSKLPQVLDRCNAKTDEETAPVDVSQEDFENEPTEEIAIPDEWLDDDGIGDIDELDELDEANENGDNGENDEELLMAEDSPSVDVDAADVEGDTSVEEPVETPLSIDLGKKPAVEIEFEDEDLALESESDIIVSEEELEDDDNTAEVSDVLDDEMEDVPDIDDIATEYLEDDSRASGLKADIADATDEDFGTGFDDEDGDEAVEHQTYMKDVEDALGEELLGLAEQDEPEADDTTGHESHVPDEKPDNVSVVGDGEEVRVWSRVPIACDKRGQEICIGDEMAYRNDWDSIGKVIGIGNGCFFTLAQTVATGNKKNSYGEVEICQWNLLENDGSIREFYHYNPDSLERIESLIDTDYELDLLVERFRRWVSKERKSGRTEPDWRANDPRC